jgi:hypothetical protein
MLRGWCCEFATASKCWACRVKICEVEHIDCVLPQDLPLTTVGTELSTRLEAEKLSRAHSFGTSFLVRHCVWHVSERNHHSYVVRFDAEERVNTMPIEEACRLLCLVGAEDGVSFPA